MNSRTWGLCVAAAVWLTAASHAAPTGTDWDAYRDARETTLLRVPPSPAAVEAEGTALALAQATFVRRVTPSKLRELEQSPATAAFLQWLVARRVPLEDFCATLDPSEDAGTVLRLWAQLWNADVPGRDKYYRLALACALVFDRPIPINPKLATGQVDMPERYEYYRRCAAASTLRAPVAELAVFELVWVVDAPVPTSELDWARHNASYSRSQWSKAYAEVEYRLDRALRGANPYKVYSLAEIKRKGGICGDQAYFAAITAKANGVPAMIIIGEGQRGGHAWFGYKASPERWNMNAGRSADDKFATGYTTDPQTRQRVKEQALLLLADYQRRQPVYAQATRLTWLAEVFAAREQPAKAILALEAAVQICSRHLPAWSVLFEQYRHANVPSAKFASQLAAMRSAFHEYPDVLATITGWEVERLRAAGNDAVAAESLREQQRRLSGSDKAGDRTDLLLAIVTERAQLLENRGDVTGADRVYRDALHDQRRNVVMFRAIADRYFAFGQRHDRRHEVVLAIDDDFRRLPVESGDPFAELAYARVERQMAGYLEQDGQTTRAKDLRERADKRERRARTTR